MTSTDTAGNVHRSAGAPGSTGGQFTAKPNRAPSGSLGAVEPPSDDASTAVYPTDRDAIEEITAAIEASGVAKASEFDVRAIFDATHQYRPALGGFVQTADNDEFWTAVRAAAL